MPDPALRATALPGPLDLDLPADAKPEAVTLELVVALALVDAPGRRAWLRCRGAALRYLDAARRAGVRPELAHRHLRAAARRWTAPELGPRARHRLRTALAFWVGTAYGLRWRSARDVALLARLRTTAARARLACERAEATIEGSRSVRLATTALLDAARDRRAASRRAAAAARHQP